MNVLPFFNSEAICVLFSLVQVEELFKNQMDPKHFGKQTEICTTIQSIHKIRPYLWQNSSITHSKSWFMGCAGKQELRQWGESTLLLGLTGSSPPFDFPQTKAACLKFLVVACPFSEEQKKGKTDTIEYRKIRSSNALFLQYHVHCLESSHAEGPQSISGIGRRRE